MLSWVSYFCRRTRVCSAVNSSFNPFLHFPCVMLCCYLNDYLRRCVCPRHFCHRELVWGARAYHSTGVKSALTPDKFPPHRPYRWICTLCFYFALFIYLFIFHFDFYMLLLDMSDPKKIKHNADQTLSSFFLLYLRRWDIQYSNR